jgi:hypothetical protein
MNNSLLEGKKPPVVPLKTRGTIFRVLSPPYFKEGLPTEGGGRGGSEK